ncbi:MAG: DUF2384 domain-containing protein [Rubellimicrobium sp.]|nr:DUF2384 domain-containing protein [Rubellimicrobium sp.]
MQLARLPPDAPVASAFGGIDNADRARLSGPALRTFRNIADGWRLSEADRLAALGYPGRSTYHSWMKKAATHAPVTLPFDTLVRISAILGIHKALSILFHDRTQALQWLNAPHRGTAFAGIPPLGLIVAGGQDGMMTVRRYLDAWRGGEVGQGAAEGSFAPVTEADVVFL